MSKGRTSNTDLEEANKVVLVFRGELCHHAHIQQHQLGRCVHLSYSVVLMRQHFDSRVTFLTRYFSQIPEFITWYSCYTVSLMKASQPHTCSEDSKLMGCGFDKHAEWHACDIIVA